jgi:hypothetical protein
VSAALAILLAVLGVICAACVCGFVFDRDKALTVGVRVFGVVLFGGLGWLCFTGMVHLWGAR